MDDTNPKQVLQEARLLVKSQQYDAALEKYIWFHEHALEADRGMAGVRLSYAISEWAELGDVYPPARIALERVRDAKTDALMNGTQDASLFLDVAAINGAFEQIDRTRDLFKSIAGNNRDVAKKCFPVAIEALIDTKDYGLARSFLTDPRSEIDQFAIPFKFSSQIKTVDQDMFEETLVAIYVKRVNLILQAFVGTGEESEANNLRNYALECIPDLQLRERIADRLYPMSSLRRIQ
ncbi:MAG TPA: hypothetical protein VK578_21865 [Edaphobacter sp.]|nr:hypothetical protein [Edaphobacter sp.]